MCVCVSSVYVGKYNNVSFYTTTVVPSAVTGLQGIYPYVVWNQPNGVITWYRLTFTPFSMTVAITIPNDQTYYIIQASDIPWTSGSFLVTVS